MHSNSHKKYSTSSHSTSPFFEKKTSAFSHTKTREPFFTKATSRQSVSEKVPEIMRVPRPTAPANLEAYSGQTRQTMIFDTDEVSMPMSHLRVHFNPAVDETPRTGFDIDYIFLGTLNGITWLHRPLKSISRSIFNLGSVDTDAVLVNRVIIKGFNLSSFSDSSATPPTPGPNTRFRISCREFDRTGRGSSAVRNIQIMMEDIGQPAAVPHASETETQRITRFARDYGFTRREPMLFSVSRFNQVLLAMSRVPHHILQTIRDIPFDIGTGNVGPNGEAAEYTFTRNGSAITRQITVYGDAFSMSTQALAFLMTHELGHAIAFRPEESSTPGTNLSAATGRGSFRHAANNDGGLRRAITTYGATNWGEYFAEAYSMYINHPDTLRILRPHVYQYFLASFPMTAPSPSPSASPTTESRTNATSE